MDLLLLIIYLLFPLVQTDSSQVSIKHKNYNTFVSQLELPDTLMLCDEVVDLTDPELRERAEREFLLLMQQTGQVLLYFKRSERYFPLYETYLKRFNLPDDLKFVSVAESALYMSRSSAGAEGLWQIMPATARSLGLRVDEYVDERRHPEKSTIAGLQYLSEGHKQFKSWALAIAGYNRGKNGIANDLNFQMKDKYTDLYLNEETSRYYFRILIIKEIMKNPMKYGFDISKIRGYKDPEVKEIKVDSAINNVAQWANDNGTDYKTVKLLNPWILKRELNNPRNESYIIRVPA
ncbi:MAG: lytic transglycosylase domain-containing protein [Ignavibacteriae bacterium]|nr:lytic transglycosylase domain-containing protein [Ignavibacteriota bacterium]MCB9221749.1 lytic transglycosylase domain-containing protein [Ignavibacteria bacterium]